MPPKSCNDETWESFHRRVTGKRISQFTGYCESESSSVVADTKMADDDISKASKPFQIISSREKTSNTMERLPEKSRKVVPESYQQPQKHKDTHRPRSRKMGDDQFQRERRNQYQELRPRRKHGRSSLYNERRDCYQSSYQHSYQRNYHSARELGYFHDSNQIVDPSIRNTRCYPRGHRPSNSFTWERKMVEIVPGFEVPLHGAHETEFAISEGNLEYANCCDCKRMVACTGDATLVLCPFCRSISPTSKAGGMDNIDDQDFYTYNSSSTTSLGLGVDPDNLQF